MLFWIAQIFGLIGLTSTVIGLQSDRHRFLLHCLVVTGLAWACMYYCLGAYSGALIALLSSARALVFDHYSKRKRIPLGWLIVFLTGIILLTIWTYDGWLSLLPMISALMYATAVWYRDMHLIRRVDIISCLIYIAYNTIIGAYIGLITSVVEMTSAAIAVYRFDVKRAKGRRKGARHLVADAIKSD